MTLYVEQFSAHPLERDAAELYGPPDGYLDEAGEFHPDRRSPGDVPVYEVVLCGSRACRGVPSSADRLDTPVYDCQLLPSGGLIAGPAIVEQADSAIVILPRQNAVVDPHGLLVIEAEAGKGPQ